MTTTRLERLELDIDFRIHDLWQELWGDFAAHIRDDHDREVIAVFMRAAYGKGYMDALKDRGELCTTHGYRLPPA